MSHQVDIHSRAIEDEDAEFVLRCQKGDTDAFEVLVERHQKKMLNIAYRMMGDYEEACDAVQEAFLAAYRGIGKFRREARFSTWLYGIVVNHAKNRMKQRETRSRHEGSSMDDPAAWKDGSLLSETPSREASTIEMIEKKELDAAVQECIRSLDGEQREALVLRDIQGFSYEEISAMLKLPDGTVKSRLFRARNALKDCLQKILGDLR